MDVGLADGQLISNAVLISTSVVATPQQRLEAYQVGAM